MAQDITIERKLNVINGFVRIPGAELDGKASLTPSEVLALIADTEQIQVSGDQRPDQSVIKFPGFEIVAPEDWFGTLRDNI